MSNVPLTSLQEFEEFISVFPKLKQDIIDTLVEKKINQEIIDWVGLSIDVNPIGGKYMRGLSVLNTIKDFKGVEQLDEETIFLGRVAGWCIEFLQASLLIADDIMDGGIMRRDRPCWHHYPNPLIKNLNGVEQPIGKIAVNDAFIMESCIYILLKKYFREKPYYTKMLELYHEISHNTFLGQLFDTSACHSLKGDFSSFNLKNYFQIARFKTSYYTFYTPVALGMLMCGINYLDPQYDAMKELLLEIGEYMTAQDDYLDCYGLPENIGKVGSDIEENKLSFLICQALNYATPEQIEELKKNYGIDNPENVKVVKKIYNDLGMKEIYRKYEDSQYIDFIKRIENMDDKVPKIVFIRLVNRCYKRNR
ncbi:hypothetical protein DICPUDRAFT_38388 [Dictyostelium purpureum]|uniref:Farnesyl diphosphate synthase n=1 Tax=Dictyostelium purpureum TaxID=5786 RepID=F0ZUD8_DICPU|nr:uncharacterized protein DICPUDRAFT_38388 [Dictyostelium purpureum]EGC32460.1 hypothetical protein DICPUDRAFT_38388 [Dictyostelium purpureum]|eukprot:XP_003291032.1 hypothetical protein DICPUDRAFT_38388 [Dictyostelium purpureum]